MIPKLGNKLIGIFYHGGYGNFKCKGSSSKDNASLEFRRRKNLIELSEKNPDAFKQIVKTIYTYFMEQIQMHYQEL